MDHCKDSESEIMPSILCVKLEQFDEDDDCTKNLDPLAPDSKVHTKVELQQDFKTEIETDGSDQTMNELIQQDSLKNALGDTATKIEEINIKTEYIGNEPNILDDVLDSHGIKKGDNSAYNQLGENSSSRHTEDGRIEISTTSFEVRHSYETHRSDEMNKQPTDDANALNVTASANNSRAKYDTNSSGGVYGLGIYRKSSSEEKGSKQSFQYVCDVCDMQFKTLLNLVSHKIVHNDQKLHVCDICNKGFSKSFNLTAHKIIHTGRKPYECDVCKKGFKQSAHLSSHKRIHTGQKPYVCEICKMNFTNSSTLIRHARIHTGEKPYVCDICKIKFSVSSALARHKRIHTGEKPYVCEICSKEFSRSFTLVTHKRTHTGQKPYVCEICKNEYAQLCQLSRHKLIHTG